MHFFKILPSVSKVYNTRTITFPTSVLNMIFLEFFFHRLLDLKARNSETFSTFKKSILRFIRPSSNFIFNCHSPSETKLITTLRLGFSQLREHKFRHNFQDTFNPICCYRDGIEATLRCLINGWDAY